MAQDTMQDEVLDWLLAGDAAVRFQTTRDLLRRDATALQAQVATEGDGATILAARHPDGHWGRGFYQPKWTCSHYSLLELRNLGLDPAHPAARAAVELILTQHKSRDGGVDPRVGVRRSDTCVNGMVLNYAAYFGAPEEQLTSIVDCLLAGQIPDGGFNCRRGPEVRHSSLHTTLSVIEGITDFERAGCCHRLDELRSARDTSVELLLRHRLFRSERDGAVIRPEFLRLHQPTRWYYDILRCLDALADAQVAYDDRMAEALAALEHRRSPDGRWSVNRSYPGETHLPPPRAGTANRWVTLRALRVLQHPAWPRSSPRRSSRRRAGALSGDAAGTALGEGFRRPVRVRGDGRATA